MERDYVSELRLPKGQLFVPQIYEYGQLQWNDIVREELLIRPAGLSRKSISWVI
jgi:hypothetical protein